MGDAYVDSLDFQGIFRDVCYVTIYYYADDSSNSWVDFAENYYSVIDTYDTLAIDGVEVAWDSAWNAAMCAIIHANHDKSEEEVTEEATCTEDGTALYTCSVCGETWEDAIAAAGHSYDSALCYFSISGSSAAAVFILACSNDTSHTVTVIADVTSVEDEETGTVAYTATAEPEVR